MSIKTILALLSLSALLTTCDGAPQPALPLLAQAEEPLVVAGWAGYMPQGILDAFHEEYGISIQYVAYDDQKEALEQTRAGTQQYDIVMLGDANLYAAVAEDLLAELDYQNIPNFRNLGANFRDLAYDPENQHSIMIQWGTTGLVARTDRLAQPITAWADLWNQEYAGKIGVWPYSADLIGITLKSLGYSMDSEDPAELHAALEKLLLLRKNVYLLDPSLPNGVANLLDDRTVMIYGWNFDAMQAQAQLDTAVYVLPKEGTIVWSDCATIPAGSRHKEAAEQFINFLLRPEISAQMVNELWIPSPNEAARPFVNAEILNNPLVYPAPENLEKAEFYPVVSEVTRKLHEQMWLRFLAEEGPVLDGPSNP